MKLFLLKIYLYKFFDDLILVYPVYTILFKDNGMSNFQIGMLLAIWASIGLTLEVPFGVLADKYNRKYLLVIGELIRSIGYLFWILGNS